MDRKDSKKLKEWHFTKVKEWHEERDASDAPAWMSADEANGWASGWNAAVEAAKAAARL